MLKSDELRREIDDEVSAAESLVSLAEREGREFTAQERATFNSHVKRADALAEEHKAVKELEENQRAMRAARLALDTPTLVYDGPSHQNDARVVTPTLTSFKGNKGQAARDAHDVGLWLKATIAGDGAARRQLESRRGGQWLASQNENNPTSGGYLVPAPLADAVIVSRQETGACRKLARVVQMGSDTLAFPKQSDGTTVYYPGEEGAITASDLDFGRVTLTAGKRAIYSLMSTEIHDDSMVSIVDLLAADMGHQFALQEDKEFILGDGTSSYGGVGGVKTKIEAATAGIATAATGHDTWAEIDASDLMGVMSKLPGRFRAGRLAWLCSAAFKWQVFDRLCLAQGGSLTINMVEGVPQAMFAGYPIVVSDFCPTSTAAATVCCYFGNWQQAVLLGERTEVRIATSEHIAFQTDQLAIRATTRYDINFHEAGDTSNAGAVVALKTAS